MVLETKGEIVAAVVNDLPFPVIQQVRHFKVAGLDKQQSAARQRLETP